MFEGITGMVSGTLSITLAPLLALGPTVSLFVVASVLTIIMTGVNRIVTGDEKYRKLRKEMKEIQEKMKESRKKGASDEADKLLTRMMEMNGEFMKYSYKNLFVSIIILSMLLPWMRAEYTGMTVATVPFSLPLVGSELSWIYWYFLVSFTMGWVIRKVLGFD